MGRSSLAYLLGLPLLACGGEQHGPSAAIVKPADDILLIGTFERRPPLGTTAIEFDKDGTVKLAHDKSKLAKETIATGTWAADKDSCGSNATACQLTLNYTEGECAQDGPGTYTVNVTKLGIRFIQKVSDSCESRSKIENQVWRRVDQ